VRLAKDALDEIQTRLTLIEELDRKLRDEASDEVGDLQPLLENCLWVFGPEFESLEFTSNKGMTTVIRELFGSTEKGSLLRPDFAMLPEGSVGLYSRDSYDERHEVNGVARLVIAEIKKPGVLIGGAQKDQACKYVKELMNRGYVTKVTNDCFVLGSLIEPASVSSTARARSASPRSREPASAFSAVRSPSLAETGDRPVMSCISESLLKANQTAMCWSTNRNLLRRHNP
jgi:hypothetical protein